MGGNSPTGPGTVTGQRNAQDIAVQGAEVNGVTRCSQSGSPDGIAQALRDGGDSASAQSFATSWSDAKGNGGLDAYVVVYVASTVDCLQAVSSRTDASTLQGTWLVNYVITFSTDAQAQAAWKAGIYIGTPDVFRSYGGTIGKDTGLGDNSATVSTSTTGWVAVWSKGSSYSALVTSYGPLTANKIAQSIAGRM